MKLPALFRRQSVLTATEGRDVLINEPDGWIQDAPGLWFVSPPGGKDDRLYTWGNPPPGAEAMWWATTLPAVTRCTSIICDTIAGLPWDIFQRWTQLDRPSWIDDPQNLARDGRIAGPAQVDVRLSAVEFWCQWLVAALWLGDGYIYVPVRDTEGRPKPPLWQFHPSEVSLEDGRYWVAGEPMLPGEIIHLRGLAPFYNGRGRGVLIEHGPDLGLAVTVRNYSQGQYRSGVPAGYLRSSQPNLQEDDAKALKEKWMEQHEGRRSIAVLNATTEFTPIQVSPLDSALDQAKTWDLRSIALMFGVPPDMLDVPGPSNTYANVESRMIELRQFTLLPWVRRVESVLDAQLPHGTSIKVRTSGLERADTKSRYESYKIALDAGFMTEDEVRLLEDLPPMWFAQQQAHDAAVAAGYSPPDPTPVPGPSAQPTTPPPASDVSQQQGAIL